jgi:DNA-binding NarL/FixJ family response regulator
LSKRTIDNHRQNILNKLGMNNTAGLVRFAVENGLLH